MRYQAALHPDCGDHNRKTPVKSTLLAEKVTGECGIKKNGCMKQYRLASHTISSHHAKKFVTFFVTFLQSETVLASISGQDGL